MATVVPQISYPADDVIKVLWEALATGDTIQSYQVPKSFGAIASVQITGTFGAATVTLAGSNDGTNFVTLIDDADAAVSKTVAALVDFSTGALFVKPTIAGGTGDDVDVTVVLRKG